MTCRVNQAGKASSETSKYSTEALKEIQALEAEIHSLRKQIRLERCEYQKENCLVVAELDEEGHCKECYASMCRDWPEDCVYKHGPESWKSKHDA
tara:strand:- start:105 stop:389 length:285 start_codon:yes stop_codon:yes gene_type:complete